MKYLSSVCQFACLSVSPEFFSKTPSCSSQTCHFSSLGHQNSSQNKFPSPFLENFFSLKNYVLKTQNELKQWTVWNMFLTLLCSFLCYILCVLCVKPFKNDEKWFLFHLKSSSISRYLSFCSDFLFMYKNDLIRKIKSISKFLTS